MNTPPRRAKTPPLKRFETKYRVNARTGCWEWTGCRDGARRTTTKDPRGEYGRFALDGYHMMAAHRASYIMFRGPVADGLQVCHTCDNPPCVNPAHLFVGTRQDNIDDMLRKKRAASQKPGYRSPRLGTGIGRMVAGKGAVVDAICAICSTRMLQRADARRDGKTPVCSLKCKTEHNIRVQTTAVFVPCDWCGTPVRRIPQHFKDHAHVYCSRSCLGKRNARELWARQKAAGKRTLSA